MVGFQFTGGINLNIHSFNIELAKQCGVDCAIFLQDLAFWIDYNRSSDINYYDDRYWTFSTIEKLCERHPYWTKKQIRRIVDKCKDNGWIITGNYNASKYNHTTWYSVNDEIMKFLNFIFDDTETEKSTCPNEKKDVPKQENRFAQMGKSIICKNNINKIYNENSINNPLNPPEWEWGFSDKLNSVLLDWLQYKKERKDQYKQKGLEMLVTQIKKKIEIYGEDTVIEAIKNSMANNWKGIIFEKVERGSTDENGTNSSENTGKISCDTDWGIKPTIKFD